ncbi:MAG: transglutaminase domain-containing protein [Coprococcus sp.]
MKRALWLHDWLLQQLDYDHSLKWSSAESALTRKLGTCQAYESAYSKLLTAAGITNAETRDTYDGHTWNAMKLDGKWYQVDCTWDDTKDNYYNFDQTHLYFGLTDELMALAHNGHDQIYTASGYGTRSTSLADNYFVRNGDAAKWARAYAERIQKNLNAGKTKFRSQY